MASVPTCLVHSISIHPPHTSTRETYLVHSQERVCFEETVEISKEDGKRQELDIGRVSIKVRQELDGFGEEKP